MSGSLIAQVHLVMGLFKNSGFDDGLGINVLVQAALLASVGFEISDGEPCGNAGGTMGAMRGINFISATTEALFYQLGIN